METLNGNVNVIAGMWQLFLGTTYGADAPKAVGVYEELWRYKRIAPTDIAVKFGAPPHIKVGT